VTGGLRAWWGNACQARPGRDYSCWRDVGTLDIVSSLYGNGGFLLEVEQVGAPVRQTLVEISPCRACRP
jgi:hypothetical protein